MSDEPLRRFLLDGLNTEPIKLGDSDIITDAVVLFRVVDPDAPDDMMQGHMPEGYHYTTTRGMTLGMAMGMVDITRTMLHDLYIRALAEDNDDDG